MKQLLLRLSKIAMLRFAVIGACGFVVDTGVLAADTNWLGMDKYSGRVLSIFVAMSFTWMGNRLLTFRHHAARGSLAAIGLEWSRFVMANLVGALCNYGVYAGLLYLAPAPLDNKYVALVCGTLVGMVFNFILSKKLVFRSIGPAKL